MVSVATGGVLISKTWRISGARYKLMSGVLRVDPTVSITICQGSGVSKGRFLIFLRECLVTCGVV